MQSRLTSLFTNLWISLNKYTINALNCEETNDLLPQVYLSQEGDINNFTFQGNCKK